MMKNALNSALLCAALGVVALTGCGEKTSTATEAAPAHDPASHASHGGHVVELAGHDLMAEFVHDESAGVVTLYVFDGTGSALTPDTAPIANVPNGDDPIQVTGTESAGAWVFTDESLKGHVHNVRFRLSVGGKSFNPALPDVH